MAHPGQRTRCREIYVKAVCGKGKKFSQSTHIVTPPQTPSSILGCWVINHQYEAVRSDNGVEVVGTYDINIWYSYDKNTKTDVAKETVSYVEQVPLVYRDPNCRPGTEEVTAVATQEPNCVEATVQKDSGRVEVRVEREFQVELIGETKLCVRLCPDGCDDWGDKEPDFAEDASEEYEELDPDLLDDETA